MLKIASNLSLFLTLSTFHQNLKIEDRLYKITCITLQLHPVILHLHPPFALHMMQNLNILQPRGIMNIPMNTYEVNTTTSNPPYTFAVGNACSFLSSLMAKQPC